MGTRERRQREKLDTREKILDAARELFVSEGYDGVSMRKIAEKIEYSPTAIYVHFKDKEQLFRELCHNDFRKLAELFQQIATIADPVERIRQSGMLYIRFGIENPNHYKLMFMTPHPVHELNDEDREMIGNPESDAYAFLVLCVQDGLKVNVFRPGLTDPHLIAQTLWAAVHGVIALEIAKHSDPWLEWTPMEQRAELMLDAAFNGLLAKGK